MSSKKIQIVIKNNNETPQIVIRDGDIPCEVKPKVKINILTKKSSSFILKNKNSDDEKFNHNDSDDDDKFNQDDNSSIDDNDIEYPNIPSDIDVYEVATKFTPSGWETEFKAKDKELKIISKNLIKASEDVEYTPSNQNIFRAFYLTPKSRVRVVIIGQDPYPAAGVANGLAFSVEEGNPIPASLRNIYKEIANCIPNYEIPDSGNLDHWAKQGVFLINTCLTCPIGDAAGHSKFNIWMSFIVPILEAIGKANRDCYYLLWGKTAQQCMSYIKGRKDRILIASHPSPLSASRGFFGCGHFKIVNSMLNPPIKW